MKVQAEAVNDTCRRYPRTLQQAFPISEGYRDSFHPPEPQRDVLEMLCWGAVIVGLVLLVFWAVVHSPAYLFH